MSNDNSTDKVRIADYLWGTKYSIFILIIATAILMFFMLDAKELWTQEWRWANICQQMILRQDFFHPYLANVNYYDKPLLSYWLMTGTSYLIGNLNLWALRLPSALAGTITVWCTYQLGKKLASQRTGCIAAWMLISTFYFVFWARVASADMLNVAGIMLATLWYFSNRYKPGLFNYTIFFLILSIASLCKGLLAIAATIVIIIPDLLFQSNWKKHLTWKLIISLIPAVIVYLAPFIASLYINPEHYQQNGLWLVFRENFLRFFQPFDHKGPLYTYFAYLPVYTLPWILFFIPAFLTAPFRWKKMPPGSRWFVWAIIFIFIFFTASGSRRSYYVLPMIPFVALVAADWIRFDPKGFRNRIAGQTAIIFSLLVFLIFCIAFPIAYSKGGLKQFAKLVQQKATQFKPWPKWHIVMLDAKTKTSFYLNSPNLIQFKDAIGDTKKNPSEEKLLKSFPELTKEPKSDTILILRKSYLPHLKDLEKQYYIINMPLTLGNQIITPITGKKDSTAPVALIPKEIQQQTTQPKQEQSLKKEDDKTSTIQQKENIEQTPNIPITQKENKTLPDSQITNEEQKTQTTS